MAITYTRSWSGKGRDDTRDGRTFSEVLTVVSDSDVLDHTNVYSATNATTSAVFPQLGDPYPGQPTYKLSRRHTPEFVGPRFARVGLVYELNASGGSTLEDDPLAQPIEYSWNFGQTGEETDVDAYRNPIVNTAGDPFASPVQTEVLLVRADAVRNEAAFDPRTPLLYTNKLNQDTFQFAGYSLQPGEALCRGIVPDPYTLDDEYVRVAYSFEFRERQLSPSGVLRPDFAHFLLDKGKRAWTEITVAGITVQVPSKIHYKASDGEAPQPVTEDVPLLQGKPLRGDQYVNDFGESRWINNPNLNVEAPITQAPGSLETDPRTGITTLLYDKYRYAAFSGLNL